MASLLLAMQTVQSYKPNTNPWVDQLPLWAMPQFRVIFGVGGIIFCCWMLYFWKTRNMKPITIRPVHVKPATLIVLLIFIWNLLGVCIQIPQSQGTLDTTIHVLGVGDEEFDAIYPTAWWSRYYGWEIYIYDCFSRFHDNFGLNFELVGWTSYDSDDSVECFDLRLQEAITETGFVFQQTIFNGKIIDLLMVFNGQYFDCQDISIPYWYAMLLCHSPEYPRTSYLCHAFSHQFYTEHCDSRGSCCMYPNWEFGLYFPADWCQTCKNYLLSTRYRDRFSYLNWRGGAGGTMGRHFRK